MTDLAAVEVAVAIDCLAEVDAPTASVQLLVATDCCPETVAMAVVGMAAVLVAY